MLEYGGRRGGPSLTMKIRSLVLEVTSVPIPSLNELVRWLDVGLYQSFNSFSSRLKWVSSRLC